VSSRLPFEWLSPRLILFIFAFYCTVHRLPLIRLYCLVTTLLDLTGSLCCLPVDSVFTSIFAVSSTSLRVPNAVPSAEVLMHTRFVTGFVRACHCRTTSPLDHTRCITFVNSVRHASTHDSYQQFPMGQRTHHGVPPTVFLLWSLIIINIFRCVLSSSFGSPLCFPNLFSSLTYFSFCLFLITH